MVKKFAAIVMFSLACVIQLAHSVIPHSHANDHEHGTQHHHGNNTEDQSIFHLFSHYQHSTENFTSQTEDVRINYVSAFDVVKIDNRHFTPAQNFCAKSLLTAQFDEAYIYISPHLVSLKFRGPPTV